MSLTDLAVQRLADAEMLDRLIAFHDIDAAPSELHQWPKPLRSTLRHKLAKNQRVEQLRNLRLLQMAEQPKRAELRQP